MSKLYDSPSDIDLIVAGWAEIPVNGGVVGPTFSCLIAKQFRKLKFGDRFFFTFGDNPNPFSGHQIANIETRKLGDIICDNTGLKMISEEVFLVNSPLKECEINNKLNIELFCEK